MYFTEFSLGFALCVKIRTTELIVTKPDTKSLLMKEDHFFQLKCNVPFQMETIENRVDGFENVFLRTTTTRIFQMFVLHIIVLRASNVISLSVCKNWFTEKMLMLMSKLII